MSVSEKNTPLSDSITTSEAPKAVENAANTNIEKEAPEILEIIEALPEISRRKITTMLSATSISGRMSHPLFENLQMNTYLNFWTIHKKMTIMLINIKVQIGFLF